jgi:hypothetical protein
MNQLLTIHNEKDIPKKIVHKNKIAFLRLFLYKLYLLKLKKS